MSLPSSPRDFSAEELYSTPGDLTLLGLAVAARDRTLEGLSRGVPELTGSGYDGAHVALVEAFAVLAAQVSYRAERLPLALLSQAFELLGLPRRGATAAVVDVFVSNPSSRDVVWTAGSLVAAGAAVYEVVSPVTVPAGAVGFGPVALSCLTRGPSGNVQAGFAAWSLVTTVPLEGVSNPQPGQGGAWAESDSEYVGRAGARLGARGQGSRAGDVLTLAEDTPGVERALVLPAARLQAAARWGQFPWGGGVWGGALYEEREGCVTVVARPFGGGYLSSVLVSRLSALLSAAEPVGVTLFVASAEEVPVDVSLSVSVEATADAEAVRGAVSESVRSWLHGSVWPWGAPLSRAELAGRVRAVPGVRAVFVSGMVPAVERGDAVSVGYDGVGYAEVVSPLLPHVLLVARRVSVEVAAV